MCLRISYKDVEMKVVVLLSLLFVGCAMTDYNGISMSTAKRPFVVQQVERDPTNEDIFYLKCFIRPVSPMNPKIEMRKQLATVGKEYGYWGYHIISSYQSPLALLNTWTFEVHFHKNEQDFDKWDRRYKE